MHSLLPRLPAGPARFLLYGQEFVRIDAAPTAAADGQNAIALITEQHPFPDAAVEWLIPGDADRPDFGRAADGYAYRFHDIGSFLFTADGSRVQIFPLPGVDPGHIDFALQRGVIPRLLHLRGVPCLHAGAVETTKGAVAFVGASGRGKSTVTAGLVMRGFRLISDDVLPLRLAAGGEVAAGPGLTSLRLYSETARELGIGPAYVAPARGDWKSNWAPEPSRVCDHSLPLRQVYLLRPFRRRSPGAALCRRGRPLGVRETMFGLVENSFWLHRAETRALATDLAVFARAAHVAPLRTLSYELSSAGLDAVARLL